jgi:ribonuclease R
MTERRADEATRDVTNWLKCYYMRDKVGESFMGTISGVAAFGAFIALDELYVEGLLHVSELGNDYYHFDPVKHELMGERTKKRSRQSRSGGFGHHENRLRAGVNATRKSSLY